MAIPFAAYLASKMSMHQNGGEGDDRYHMRVSNMRRGLFTLTDVLIVCLYFPLHRKSLLRMEGEIIGIGHRTREWSHAAVRILRNQVAPGQAIKWSAGLSLDDFVQVWDNRRRDRSID